MEAVSGESPPRAAQARALATGALLGPPVAFAAALYLLILHEVTDAVWHDLPDAAGWDEVAWWYVLAVPALAGLLVAAALRLPGRGGLSPVGGLRIHPLLPGQLPSVLVAALASLAGGLVLGPEGPLIALGLTLGLIAARLTRAGERETKLLALAGAFAALSSILAGPIPSSLMLLELAAATGLVAAGRLGPSLLPGFLAAGTGALLFAGVGSWPGVRSSQLRLAGLPDYPTVHAADVAWCVPVALAAALLVLAARRGAESIATRAGGRTAPFLVGGGLAVGALALVFRELADRPESLVLFSGQAALPALAAETSAGVLVALLAAKGLAYAVSLGAGFRGGPIFPAVALGVATGALAADVLPGLALTAGIVAGLAAGAVAAIRMPFAAAVLAVLVAGGAAPDAVPIAILAAVTGWLAMLLLDSPRTQAATGSAARPAGAPGRLSRT
jgi:chloride channel protein, CIC family